MKNEKEWPTLNAGVTEKSTLLNGSASGEHSPVPHDSPKQVCTAKFVYFIVFGCLFDAWGDIPYFSIVVALEEGSFQFVPMSTQNYNCMCYFILVIGDNRFSGFGLSPFVPHVMLLFYFRTNPQTTTVRRRTAETSTSGRKST